MSVITVANPRSSYIEAESKQSKYKEAVRLKAAIPVSAKEKNGKVEYFV